MRLVEPKPRTAVLILAGLTLLCLLPFAGKAFHIDDPLFIWTARQIRAHPLNFYGFEVNWGRRPLPMQAVMFNPPLAPYCLALAGSALGWSEVPLHLAFSLAAIATVIGAYFTARELCAFPFAAALATLAAPCFLVCGTSVMCDMTMAAFWVWAIFFWIRGSRENRGAWLAISAVFVSASALSKYFGVCLVPLLLAWTLWKQRAASRQLLFLCAPVVVMIVYEMLTRKMYGQGLFAIASENASRMKIDVALDSKLLTGAAFVGGCIFVPLAASPLIFRKKALGIIAAAFAVLLFWIFLKTNAGVAPLRDGGHFRWFFAIQLVVLALGGLMTLYLAVADFVKHRNADSLLLLLWTFGTFIFATCLNWGVAGRNILPIAPAAGILLARRLEPGAAEKTRGGSGFLWIPIGVSLGVSLLAAWADWSFANSAKTAALEITRELKPQTSRIAFEGHWGFQYYMQELGASPLNADDLGLVPNEVVIVPLGNSYLFPLPRSAIAGTHTYHFPARGVLSLMDRAVGAGFYSDGWGPLPFALRGTLVEDYAAFRIGQGVNTTK
jgi:4-amino-4-deoxy-L-arabinose transferase-like glycosyltransferase